MTKQCWFGAVGIGVLAFHLGCSHDVPTAPSRVVGSNFSVSTVVASTIAPGSVTFQPDQTANPASITVPADSKLLMINRSGQYVRLHSSNCSEFRSIGLFNGESKHTLPFTPAGKTCNYFAFTDNRTRRIFQGEVVVR